MKDSNEIRKSVRKGYAKIVKGNAGNCCCGGNDAHESDCCSASGEGSRDRSRAIGYSDREMDAVPEGANLGLGCGNPVAIASINEGETILDLGSGAGFDCFLAARKAGKSGKVIGVDMTPDMLEKARGNAKKGNFDNVEFRLGEIENLPVGDCQVDAVISNCVINLSPEKEKVFREAYRVLKPGGRLMVSDIVLEKELPEYIKESARAYIGCVSGAEKKEDYLRMIADAGFDNVRIVGETGFGIEGTLEDPEVQAILKKLDVDKKTVQDVGRGVKSIKVSAVKP